MKKDGAKTRNLVTGDYPTLEPSFVNEVKATRTQDPFNPLLVFVSSKLLGLHLRRLLAENGIHHFNLRFLTLEEFAREISTPHLLAQGKKELPPHADELIIGNIAKSLAGKDKEFYFRDIVDRPGFHRAILSTLKDLKDAFLLPGDIERPLRDAKISKQVYLPKLKDLLKLWKGYQEQLEGLKCYDESDLMISASQWVKDSIYLRQTLKMLIYGFYDFNASQKRVLETCFDEKETTAFLPYESTHAFEFVKPALKWFRDIGFKETCIEGSVSKARSLSLDHLCLNLFNDGKPLENPSKKIQIISAPGEPREVREVIRTVLQTSQIEGIPFHEIGIVLRSPQEYSRLFKEAFDNLGIEPYLREGLPFIETRAGRSLLLLLNITRRNFSRQSVMEFATFTKLRTDRFPSEGGFALNLPRWDAISIQAGIVEGQKEWEERLRRLRESWLKKGEAEEEDEGKKRFHKEDVIALDQLIQFTQKLFVSIELLGGSNTWNGKVAALLNAYDGFVEHDEEGLLVKQAVRRLSELDISSIPPSPGDFARLVDEVLQGGVIPNGRFQRNGPTVGNLMAVRGVPFKMVIVPGMVEKSFPPLIRQDAILLDQERNILNRSLGGKESGPLTLKAEGRLDEERLLFRLAVGAATEKLILSFPRIEIGTGRERLPSSFLLASIKALTGKSVDFNQLESFPGFVRIPLSEIAVKSPEEALDELEFDLSIGQEKLAEKKPEGLLYLREVSSFFGRGIQLEFSRWGKRIFTGYEGVFSSKEALQILRERYSIFKKSISPTRLEAYAACPYQYLLNVIMGVEALTEPEKEVTITPLDKGKLIHDILWKFFTDLKKERDSSFQLKPKDLERLVEVTHKKFVEFEQMGVTGFSMLWEVEKRNILGTLKDFFNEELNETEFTPTYFEVRYGMRHLDFEESEISTEEPVLLKIGEKTVNLRGKIDRIDLTKDGKRARVRDYKTGKVLAKPNEFQGGTTLQLPLYLYAARQLLGSLHKGIQVESAEYYSLKDQEAIPFEASQLDEKETGLQEILKTIAEGIEEGVFIPYPDDQHCKYRYCDFRLVCGSWAQILFDRKSKDPRVKRYLEMVTEETEEGEE
jgi:ATP-dependent helicase/nuclease subunit B